MIAPNQELPPIFELMLAVKRFTRITLLHQHAVATEMGLHVTDAECIDFLQEMGPSSAGQLAKATGLTTGAITNVIDRLEKAGFVTRSNDPADRRKVIVTFQPKKHARTRKRYAALAEEVHQLFLKYKPAQLKLLIRYTRELEAVYQQQIGNIE